MNVIVENSASLPIWSNFKMFAVGVRINLPMVSQVTDQSFDLICQVCLEIKHFSSDKRILFVD